MPGPHVDLAYNNAIAKLDDTTNPKSIGGDVFRDIQGDNTLTDQEKQEVHQRLGKTCMERELAVANNQPNTFLRLATSHTNFVTAYMNEHTKDYKEAVLQTIAQESEKVQIPKDPGLKDQFPVLGNPRDAGSKEKPETLVALEDEATKLGSAMIRAHDDNLDKLSPEAREFLRVTMEPVVALNNDQMTSRAMSSTVMLKVTGPEILSMGQKMGGGQDRLRDLGEEQMKANMLVQASKVMLTYANNVEKPPGTTLGTKAQDKMAEKLLTSENLDRTNGGYSALAKGTLDNHVAQQKVQLEAQLAQQKVQPFDDRLQKLNDKKDHLEHHATVGDKIKAFFKHGLDGVDGEIAKLNKKIEATQHAKDDVEAGVTVAQRRDEIDRAKDSHTSLGEELNRAKGVMVMKNMEASGMNMGSTVSDSAIKEARETYSQVKPAQKELAKQIKAEERALSVREKLGPKTDHGDKSHGQSHGHSV